MLDGDDSTALPLPLRAKIALDVGRALACLHHWGVALGTLSPAGVAVVSLLFNCFSFDGRATAAAPNAVLTDGARVGRLCGLGGCCGLGVLGRGGLGARPVEARRVLLDRRVAAALARERLGPLRAVRRQVPQQQLPVERPQVRRVGHALERERVHRVQVHHVHPHRLAVRNLPLRVRQDRPCRRRCRRWRVCWRHMLHV